MREEKKFNVTWVKTLVVNSVVYADSESDALLVANFIINKNKKYLNDAAEHREWIVTNVAKNIKN